MWILLVATVCLPHRPVAVVRQAAGDVYRAEILASQIVSGPYAGGYLMNEKGAGMSFYFTSVGLLAVATDSRFQVGKYLSLYLSKSNEYGLVQEPYDLCAPSDPDADDSDASSFLNLAAAFYPCAAGRAWWTANAAPVKAIASKVLLANQVVAGPGAGLISTFSKYRVPKTLAEQQGQDNAYLMDQCENYAALSSLANVLGQMGDSSAAAYSAGAALLAKGIQSYYFFPGQMFFYFANHIRELPNYSGAPLGAKVNFYANRMAQVYPQLYGVPLGSAVRTSVEYTGGWHYMNQTNANWESGFPDASVGPFPMMELGYVAALRGQTSLVDTQKAWFDSQYAQNDYYFWDIDEVGFRLRLGN